MSKMVNGKVVEVMSEEEQYLSRLECIKVMYESLKDESDNPQFSVKWLIDNIMYSDEDRRRAERELIYEKRKIVIKKLIE